MVIFVNVQVVTKTMPENNIHHGDDELGGVQNHSHYHNVTFLFYSNLKFYLPQYLMLCYPCFFRLSSFKSCLVYVYIDVE